MWFLPLGNNFTQEASNIYSLLKFKCPKFVQTSNHFYPRITKIYYNLFSLLPHRKGKTNIVFLLVWKYLRSYHEWLLWIRENMEHYGNLAKSQSPKVMILICLIIPFLHQVNCRVNISPFSFLKTVHGDCLCGFSGLSLCHPRISTWGSLHGPERCKPGPTIWGIQFI